MHLKFWKKANPQTKYHPYCCDYFHHHVNNWCHNEKTCPGGPLSCPDCVLVQTGPTNYGLPIHDGGGSYISISFCPWCGTRLIDPDTPWYIPADVRKHILTKSPLPPENFTPPSKPIDWQPSANKQGSHNSVGIPKTPDKDGWQTGPVVSNPPSDRPNLRHQNWDKE